jgi:hypothetical protein
MAMRGPMVSKCFIQFVIQVQIDGNSRVCIFPLFRGVPFIIRSKHHTFCRILHQQICRLIKLKTHSFILVLPNGMSTCSVILITERFVIEAMKNMNKSRQNSCTTEFKLEVVRTAPEIGNGAAGRIFRVG